LRSTTLALASSVLMFSWFTEVDMPNKTENELNDVQTALSLTDDPCIVAGPQGLGSIDKKTFAKMLESPQYIVNDFELDDVKVRMLSNDVAVLAYKVHEELEVDGEPVTMDAVDSSTWVRKNGRWVCALHTESLVGDPFGRDRQPAG
jgi:hypothetical protein